MEQPTHSAIRKDPCNRTVGNIFRPFIKKQPELPFVCGTFRLAGQSPVFLFRIEKSSGASVCKAVYVLHFYRKLTFQCYKTYIVKGRLAMTGCPWVYIIKGRLAMTGCPWGYRQKE